MDKAKIAMFTQLLVLAWLSVTSQEVEHYSLESAILEKNHARTLILNLNDTFTSPSLEGIGSLRKLETLIVFPVSSAIHGPFKFKALNDSVMIAGEYYYDNAVTSIPEEIGNCTELKVLKVNEARITHLPKSLGNLSKLEVLELSLSKLDEEELLAICSSLKGLKHLDIYGCDLSDEAIHELRKMLPHCKIVLTMSDYQALFPKPPFQQRIFINSTQRGLRFETEQLALQFLNSLPTEMIRRWIFLIDHFEHCFLSNTRMFALYRVLDFFASFADHSTFSAQ